MTTAEILEYARAAGFAGRGWMDFTGEDTLQAYCIDHCDAFDSDAIEDAFHDGRRAWRVSGGWAVRWTTAPEGFDGFGTDGEACGDWKGRTLRRVLIDPQHVTWQSDRYGSGLHATYDEDPRITEADHLARIERLRVDDVRRAALRAAGLDWITALADAALEHLDGDEIEAHGLTYMDRRAEIDRRTAACDKAERVATWSRCRALVPDGAIIVDDGAPSTASRYGRIPGRDPHVWYDVRITNEWEGIADRANVTGARDDNAGSLEMVADWITSGRLRVVGADAVPPEPVLRRVGHARLAAVRRVTVGDRVVWVARPTFAPEPLVLDERGHIVRSRKIRDVALATI